MKQGLWLAVAIAMMALAGCGGGSSSAGSAPVTNHAPVASLTSSTSNALLNEMVTVTCTATDADSDTLTYTWSCSSGAVLTSGTTITWKAPATEGTATVTCKVQDGQGGEVVKSVVITVTRANTPPTISRLTAEFTTIPYSRTVGMACTASDPDGDHLNYFWTCDRGTISGTTQSVSWVAPDSIGDCIITCTVRDGRGGVATDLVIVTVRLPHPPTFTSFSISPSTLRFVGGQVTINGAASGEAAVAGMKAYIHKSGAADIPVDMTAVAGGYRGTWTAPANLRVDGLSEDYTITVKATDSLSQTTESAPATLTVLPLSNPPPPPPPAPAPAVGGE